MMPTGEMKSCATMCLKGGQITAVFSCNPQATFSNYADQSVEVQGHWAGGGAWEDVNCATMH
jgi:hypothetical protein